MVFEGCGEIIDSFFLFVHMCKSVRNDQKSVLQLMNILSASSFWPPRLWAGFLGSVPSARQKLVKERFDQEMKKFKGKRVLKKQATTSATELEELALKLPIPPSLPECLLDSAISVATPSSAIVIDGTVADAKSVYPAPEPANAMLMPASLELAKDCCQAGVLVAPSILLPGQKGVFAVRDLPAHEFLFHGKGQCV